MCDFGCGVQLSRRHWQHSPDPDGNGVQVDLGAFNGTIAFGNGETAVFVGVETVDLSRTDEAFSGTLVALLPDGSASHQRFSGRLTFRDPGGRIGGTGEWQALWGTGRLAGLTGGGGMDWVIEAGLWRASFRARA